MWKQFWLKLSMQIVILATERLLTSVVLTVLLEHCTDCSIRVFRSFAKFLVAEE